MKSILLILCLLGFSIASNAQFGRAALLPVLAGDTLDSLHTNSKIITLTAGYNYIAVQPVLTRTSATLAGTIVYSASLDGVNYITQKTTNLVNAATFTDIYTLRNCPFVYLKYTITQTNRTGKANCKGYYVLRKTITQ